MLEKDNDEVVIYGSHEIWRRPLGQEAESEWEPTQNGVYVYIEKDIITIHPTEKMRLDDETEYQLRPIRGASPPRPKPAPDYTSSS
jgi:hypothetical protein